MSAASESPDELPRLLSALADGTLDQAKEERLVELLRTDPVARAKYYDHVILAALLRREGRRAAAQGAPNASDDIASQQLALAPAIKHMAPARPASRRLRLWLMVLAASVLLALLFSVGEATGVTNFVPTIVRIVTGEGSLVIEVDDPSVSVTLDGEDVTIKGAGIHELRLRPGTHRFVATKDGQSVREEVVTIEHGGRQVVKVTREPASSPAPPELTASERLDRAKEGWDEASAVFQQGQKLRDSDPLEAERCLRRALALFEQFDKDFPGTKKYRGSIGPCRWYLASALNMQSHQIVFQSTPPTSQEAARAIELSKEAVALTPHTKEWLSNLGRAYYRAGDWNNAKMTLEEALAVGKAVEVDRFFLAMTHWQLGDKDQARRLYDGMVELLTKTPSRDRYVLRTRAEAAAVLGVEATSP